MPSEPLWNISVTNTPEAEDAVAEMLSSIFGVPASAYHDFERGVSTVTVYVSGKLGSLRRIREEISIGLKRIKRCGLEVGRGKPVIARIQRRNWAESWKRHFKPIEIGQVLLIKPSWSKRRSRKGQAVVVLDPGLSFGTGHHPTTAFCLREMVAAVYGRRSRRSQGAAANKSFLDLGTGSGILAIAAAKLGYSVVHALDFDLEAVRIAGANARANRVHRKLTIRRQDVAKLSPCPGRRGQRYDLICANLVADLLLRERHRIAARLNPAGRLVLAGILKKEFPTIQKGYEDLGLKIRSCRSERDWCSGTFGR